MSLKEVMEPAIKVSEEGFPLDWRNTIYIMLTAELFSRYPGWKKIFMPNGKVPQLPMSYVRANPIMQVNKDLAKSLRSIANDGPEAFYKGWIAKAIAKEMVDGGGLITVEDLAMYEPIIHSPDPGSYRGYTVVYDPTHSGTTMLQTLKILEGYDLTSYGFDSPETVHLLSEALGFAFADRFKYMGDPGWVDVPYKAMVSDEYAEETRKKIDMNKAAKIGPGDPWPYEPECTTALTVGDGDGNLVAVNQTVVNAFGCGVVVRGTGIVMNNAMYGLNPEPGHANSIDGRKRRIQNVCPSVLLKDGKPFMAVGAPGGRAIQMSISQVILNVIDHGMGIQDAISAPRVFRESQGILVDNRYSEEVRRGLIDRGHDLSWLENEMGNWAAPVGVIINPETGMLHGGVACGFLGFRSEAIGI
jgi:gamma-glutamyltranspeptidase/glutathione hydrolase